MIQINPNRTIENTFPDSTPKTATDKFTTLDGGLVNSLTVEMTPVQDLHGYDKPWAGGAGKNLLPMTLSDIKSINTDGTWSGNVYSWRGIDYTVEVDSDNNVTGISASGTATQRGWIYLCQYNFGNDSAYFNNVTSGGYTFTSGNSNDNTSTQFIYYNSSSPYNTYIRIENGVNLSNEKWYPMVRLSSIADPTFEPYSNICPISGHTEAKAQINNTVYTTSLGTTVYGGELDMVSGEGEVSYDYIQIDKTRVNAKSSLTACDIFLINMPAGTDLSDANTVLNIFGYSNQENVNQVGMAWRGTSNTQLRIGFSAYGTTTLEDFKTWLDNNALYIAHKTSSTTPLSITGQSVTAEVGENNVSAPLDGQEIQTDGVTYKEMFSWADVVAYVQSQVNP